MVASLKTQFGFLDGFSRPTVAVLGLAVAFAAFGIGSALVARSRLADLRAHITAAGLDTSNLRALEDSITDKQRQIVRLENALVSLGAAVDARGRQLSSSIARYEGIEASSAAAVKAAETADAKAASLAVANEDAARTLTRTENALVAAAAAVEARKGQLVGLSDQIQTNAAVIAEANAYQAEKAARLAEAADRERTIVGLENRIVSLSAAAGARDVALGKAIEAQAAAETAERAALIDTLKLRAEAGTLERDRVKLVDARAAAERAAVEADNRLVAATAAATAREAQVAKLAGEADGLARRHAELTDASRVMEGRLAEADARLARLVDATNRAAEALALVGKGPAGESAAPKP